MPSVAPPTAYPPGTKLTVGSHEVVIKKYISEGGFAHVYSVYTDPPLPGQDVACLKRVAVPDKTYLNLLRAEVEAMQRLQDSPNVVHYIDSHAERMRDGGTGYEVFLLMEFCDGSLIDFMNTRLRDQLREFEVLKIMYDITLGLAQMHYLQPPLIHRDLKIENVLIAEKGKTYKLCDFGSASPPLRVPKTPGEFRILEDDIQHHTTLQYRSPEMVDLKRNQPIDEKSDIWALGVFLYKLCFYTTPFERPNQTMEQLNAQIASGIFTIPNRPAYSDRLHNMIRVLLQVNPAARPNIYQVLEEVSAMRNVECPIPNIYRTPRTAQPMPPQIAQAPQQQQPQQSLPIPGAPQPSHLTQIPAQNQAQMPLGVNANMMAPPPALLVSLPGQSPTSHSLPPQMAPHVQHDVLYDGLRPAAARVAGPRPLQLADEPPSPLTRAISPGLAGLSEDDAASRFPSLEELNKTLPPPKPPKHAVRPTPAPAAVAVAPPPVNVVKPTKTPEFPMPHRPPRPAKKQESLTVPTTPVAEHSDDMSSGEFSDSSPERPTRKLSKILTDISERSSTVIMQADDRNKDLSSVDFLRSLDHEHTGSRLGHAHSRPTSAHGHRHKPSLSTFFGRRSSGHSAVSAGSHASDNDDDDDDDDVSSFVPHLQRRPVTYSATDDQKASVNDEAAAQLHSKSVKDLRPSTSSRLRYSRNAPAATASTTAAPAPAVSTQPVQRPKPKPKPKPVGDSDISSPTSSEEESPPLVDLSDTDGKEGDTSAEFRPSNLIQQRVKAFLSEAVQDQQKRMYTAKGYGKYNDEQSRQETGTGAELTRTSSRPKTVTLSRAASMSRTGQSRAAAAAALGASKSSPNLVKPRIHPRPKSVIVAKPVTPGKPVKTKLPRVHSDESFETVGKGRKTPPPKPKSPKPVLSPTQGSMKPLKPVPAPRTTRLRSE